MSAMGAMPDAACGIDQRDLDRRISEINTKTYHTIPLSLPNRLENIGASGGPCILSSQMA